jgi:hypothetical protein
MNIHDITKQIRAFADELDAVKAPEKPDDGPPWIKWHGGPCPLRDDEVEEFQIKYGYGGIYDYDIPPSTWHGWENTGMFTGVEAYRVLKARTPTPKQPLGPQDVAPGSVLLSSSAGVNGMQWTWVHCVKSRGVEINGRDCIAWAELKEHWKINRPKHRDENGNPTLWEACER